MSFNIHSTRKDDFCSYCDKEEDCPLCKEKVKKGYCNAMEINGIRVYRYLEVDRNGVESDCHYLLDDFERARFLTSQDIKGREAKC